MRTICPAYLHLNSVIVIIMTISLGNYVHPPATFSFLGVGILLRTLFSKWARGSVVVKAICYKPEGRGFDTR
jgi:hypothetical protein